MQVQLTNRVHLPALLIFFEIQEWATIGVGYFIGLTSGGWWWLAVLVVPMTLIPYGRKQPRGYFTHLTVKYGVAEIQGYPALFVTDFKE